jgi:carboxymethylenebutenolidase
MFEHTVDLETPFGAMPTFVVHPERARAPPVLMLMDGLGMREVLRDQARRLAACGYFVLLPNLYYHRHGPLGDPNLDYPQMAELIGSISNERVIADARACLDYARQDAAALPGRAGVIGYCFGGRVAMVLAQALGTELAAVASLHPGGMVTDKPTSPHNNLDHVAARVYLGCCEDDPIFNEAAIAEFAASLKAAGVNYEVEAHPGTHHGYTMPGTPGYQKAASERVWERVIALFGETL